MKGTNSSRIPLFSSNDSPLKILKILHLLATSLSSVYREGWQRIIDWIDWCFRLSKIGPLIHILLVSHIPARFEEHIFRPLGRS